MNNRDVDPCLYTQIMLRKLLHCQALAQWLRAVPTSPMLLLIVLSHWQYRGPLLLFQCFQFKMMTTMKWMLRFTPFLILSLTPLRCSLGWAPIWNCRHLLYHARLCEPSLHNKSKSVLSSCQLDISVRPWHSYEAHNEDVFVVKNATAWSSASCGITYGGRKWKPVFCDTHGLLANLDICAVFIVIAAGSKMWCM